MDDDRTLARVIRRCQDLPGQRLFEYVDPEGKVQPISSDDVNDYLRAITAMTFTSKDFRTWKGSVLALCVLTDMGKPTSRTQAQKNIVQAMKRVAAALGNRPATARKYYVHPAILDAYGEDRLNNALDPGETPSDLCFVEYRLLHLLETESMRISPSLPASARPATRPASPRSPAAAATGDRACNRSSRAGAGSPAPP